jgi:hypothetical protein
MWHAWLRLMGRRMDTLFVASAGNDGIRLTGFNYSPGGISLPNVITVGATGRCNPTKLGSLSNFGSPVDVAAPGEGVPVVVSSGLYAPASGTSFSAPIVTSLAAILKSIRPSLTPRQIKNYITQYSFPLVDTDEFGRVVFTSSISQLLIDMSVGDPIETWLDPMGLGTFGASGLVLSRLCPSGMTYSVDGYGMHEIYASDENDDDIGLGTVARLGASVTLSIRGVDDSSHFTVGTTTLSAFVLGTYPIMADPVTDSFVAAFEDFDSFDSGLSVAGSITLDTCRIDERDPFDGIDPWILILMGSFEGTLEVNHFDGRDPTLHDFQGHFSMPTVLALDDEETIEYVESICEGGIPRDVGSAGSPDGGE